MTKAKSLIKLFLLSIISDFTNLSPQSFVINNYEAGIEYINVDALSEQEMENKKNLHHSERRGGRYSLNI